MAKKPRPRSERREAERALSKLARSREQLFKLELGGSPERPIAVVSAAVIEAQAESMPCPRCAGRHELVEHVALTMRGVRLREVRLREVRLRCRQCGSLRSVWFVIRDVGPS